ncbi:unnamed protein product [Strongylus vulgaris]|uniref:Uncharacterized protein n=1 Tax=Strongylus vulgaris TaxID=40348 RepID=A0A3P7JIC5_STRVU|nr:unnamed protein product [Strongylus vulgaris]
MTLSVVHKRPLLFSIVSSSLVVCALCALVDCEGRRRFPINICILSAGFVPVIAIIVTVARSHSETVERLKERYEAQVGALFFLKFFGLKDRLYLKNALVLFLSFFEDK